jgi:hypothetical protein
MCTHCGRLGHLERDCRKKKAEEACKTSSSAHMTALVDVHAAASPRREAKCYNCGELGHYSTSCTKRKKNYDGGKSATPAAKMAQVTQGSDEEPEPAIEGKKVATQPITTEPTIATNEAANKRVACLRTPCYLEGQKVMAFVDGGATTSFVDRRWINKNGLTIEPRPGTLTQFVDGSTLPCLGVVTGLTLENGDKILQVDLEAADLSGKEE